MLENAATCLELEALLPYLSKAMKYSTLAVSSHPFCKFDLNILSKQMQFCACFVCEQDINCFLEDTPDE